MVESNKRRLIIGITGASGAIYGIRLLTFLQELGVETHLVISNAGKITIKTETEHKLQDIVKLATHHHNISEIGACISSGSYKADGMIIAPCSMKTMATIACGLEDNLISRSAGVMLKERKRLVILPRETPLTNIHLENMLKASQAGAIIAPPVPAFYNEPKNIDDIVNHTCYRVLDLFGLEAHEIKRWKGLK